MIDLSRQFDGPVAVLGLGRSGLAAAQALAAAGVIVWAWDDDGEARVNAAAHGIRLRDPSGWDLGAARALVLSPGIPHAYPSPHPVAARARAAGCPLIGDLELLIRAQPAATYVGVTGTNGKSTTTALIGHVLAAAGRSHAVGGNIGVPVLALPPQGAGSIYVLEISSYQLELTPSLACQVAVLLNISPDHLARHGGMDGYVAAKRLMFRRQPRSAIAVVGIDDPYCRAVHDDLIAACDRTVAAISVAERPPRGVFAAAGALFDVMSGGSPQAVLELAAAGALPGAHNAQNAAAAYAVARTLGVVPAVAASAIADFPGLAHRQERVGVINGVTYVNDSKATNPDAAARALACYRSIYWIAGGRPKEGDLEPLYPYLERVRHAYLIGEASDRFAADLGDRVAVSRCQTLDRAVAAARATAEANGAADAVVLLSPACASFDQFRNFEARGEVFRELVRAMRS